ncbi:hypothetical protein CTI12_AA160320 [Artemisia annua]|uniref:Uncharacterized protein n=1 Tax=Artemisia annua TaxID=35608 RepID=A0A2U1PEV5_ARTAN|nr:hypothetical protein CTI12_AA160320 [Artemisia annua]
MAAVRLTRMSKATTALGGPTLQSASTMGRVKLRFTCMAAGFGLENGRLDGDVERKPVMATKAATCKVAALDGAVTATTQTSEKVNLATLIVVLVRTAVERRSKIVMKPTPWSLIIQSFVEKVIMDSRFFTIFGVAGTLLGSVLCFMEGVFLVAESYLQYFHAMYQHSDHSHIMHLLIEALDMFLIGTAMLTFGMGLHLMFVGSSRASKGNGLPIPQSNFFGLFYLKEIPSWTGMNSISQAKSKFGHALMLLLQVGVLDKFKSIPLVTGLDLACFAASVFVSSAGIFILSRIAVGTKT